MILLHATNTAELVAQAKGRKKVNKHYFYFFTFVFKGVNLYPWQHFVSEFMCRRDMLSELGARETSAGINPCVVTWPATHSACWVNLNTNNLITLGRMVTQVQLMMVVIMMIVGVFTHCLGSKGHKDAP